jgi:3-oxoacyl-[acyl-carrier-protein] synthase-3
MKKWMKIIQRFYKLYDRPVPQDIMPMSIHELGNSGMYLLFDLLIRGQIKDQRNQQGRCITFASVGAGMNVNAFIYRY